MHNFMWLTIKPKPYSKFMLINITQFLNVQLHCNKDTLKWSEISMAGPNKQQITK